MLFRSDVLADAVAWAARTLPSRPSMPMLAGLLIDAAPGGLTLSSFDYEVSAQATVPALYFTNLISARPLMGPMGAGSLAQVINAAIANKPARWLRRKSASGEP